MNNCTQGWSFSVILAWDNQKGTFLTHFFNFGHEGAPNVTKITYNMKILWENSPRKKNWGSFVHRGLRYDFLRKKIWTVPLILQFNISIPLLGSLTDQWIGGGQRVIASGWGQSWWRLTQPKKTEPLSTKSEEEGFSGRRNSSGWVWQTDGGRVSGSTSRRVGGQALRIGTLVWSGVGCFRDRTAPTSRLTQNGTTGIVTKTGFGPGHSMLSVKKIQVESCNFLYQYLPANLSGGYLFIYNFNYRSNKALSVWQKKIKWENCGR